MNMTSTRSQILANYELNKSEINELLVYNQNHFQTDNWQKYVHFPLEDEPHVSSWQEYAEEARVRGTYQTLSPYLVQLQFPIQAGISDRPEYRAVTRKGQSTDGLELAGGLSLQEPDKLELLIHQTLAGKIPVLIAGNRADFISLVRALTKKNEPQPIPDSMGACIVGGYNNWHRIFKYRQQWSKQNPQHNSEADWKLEFKKLIPRKELYQDRFILLSPGGYSGVTAAQLGLKAAEWQQLSLQIRLEHECTHYITRRLLNSMQNNLLDEIIADYRGIVAAFGSYRADWFLYFMGLESPEYRSEGRLSNYRGDPPLSNNAFQVLQTLVRQAAQNLENFDRQYYQSFPRTEIHDLAVSIALTKSSLEDLASANAVELLLANSRREFNSLEAGLVNYSPL